MIVPAPQGDGADDGNERRSSDPSCPPGPAASGRGARRPARTSATLSTLETGTKAARTKNGRAPRRRPPRRAPTARRATRSLFVWTYLQQVVAELRKVIWPNRKQMVSYTTVVLVFLAFMVTLIGLVDLGLAKLVMAVFG